MFDADSPLVVEIIPAAHFQEANRSMEDILGPCIHTTESDATAEQLCRSASRPDSREVSWGYALDEKGPIQCVPERCISWSAGHRGNLERIHIEVCAHAKWTREEWCSRMKLLHELAALVEDICFRTGKPLEFVGGNQPGVTTHKRISDAYHLPARSRSAPAASPDDFTQRLKAARR